MDEKKLKRAQTVFKNLCERLDEIKWNFERNEEDLQIECTAQGDDLPISLRIAVDEEREIITLLSQLPYTTPEKRRAMMAVAVSKANNGMIDGNFDFDLMSGNIVFRLTSSYRESLIDKEVFTYLLSCACYTVDEYNDKFLFVAKNDMTVEEILKYIK